MADTRNVRCNFNSIRQPDASDFAQRRVRLLRRLGIDAGANTATLWRLLQCRTGCLVLGLGSASAHKLIKCRQAPLLKLCNSRRQSRLQVQSLGAAAHWQARTHAYFGADHAERGHTLAQPKNGGEDLIVLGLNADGVAKNEAQAIRFVIPEPAYPSWERAAQALSARKLSSHYRDSRFELKLCRSRRTRLTRGTIRI
jgi:hypothetical protein